MEHKDSYESHRSPRPYYDDPTANTAIGNVMREVKAKKKQGRHNKTDCSNKAVVKNTNKDTGGKKRV